MRIFSGRLGSREAVCVWVCMCVCTCGCACLFVVFVINLSCSFRTSLGFFSLFGFFYSVSCLLVCLFSRQSVSLDICLCVAVTNVAGSACRWCRKPSSASSPPSSCPLLFIWTGCRRHSVIRSIVWSRVAAALLWSALHWLQLFRMSGEVEKTCGKFARSGTELRILKRELWRHFNLRHCTI